MMRCKNLSVNIGRKLLLDNISFNAKKGEITVIIGKNGSGKSTLLRALSNNISFKGEVEIANNSIKKYSNRQKARLMALMPQELPSVPISVETLVSFGRQPYTGISGILSQKDTDTVKSAIDITGIAAISERTVNTVSGGEKRLAYFAMMLAQESPILLLDEPSANLDAVYKKHILELIRKSKAKGNTVICILHDINQAIEIADKLILLESGKIVFCGDSEEFCNSDIPKLHFGLQKYEYTDDNKQKGVIYK